MAGSAIDSNEFISALEALAKERRINKDVLFSAIESALMSAYKKNFGNSFGGPHYAAAISFVEEFISAMRHYLNVKGIWFTLENLDELY